MKHLLPVAAVLAIAACAAPAPEISAAEQAGLDAALAGRTAGTPQDCVSTNLLRGNRSFGEGVILFEGLSRGIVYVNRPPAGCPQLDQHRALRYEAHTNRLCRGEIVTIFDPSSGVIYGSCSLGDFVPYRR